MNKKIKLMMVGILMATLLTSEAGAYILVDWESIDINSNIAVGNIDGISVSFTGSDIDQGVTNNTFTGFNSTLFTPPIANTDMVGFRGAPVAYNYLIAFSDPVEDPVFHFYSLASVLYFSTSNITKLSGDSNLIVSDNTISGVLNDNPPGYDSNGSVKLEGLFTTISFSAYYFDSVEDGIVMQFGANPVPIPSTIFLLGSGLLGIAIRRLKKISL